MEKELFNKRKVYNKFELSEENILENPMEMFRLWYDDAENSAEIIEPNTMTISTVENGVRPRSRVVLLKKYTWEGFIFFTNYDSRKGKALISNPEICLNFYWSVLERQVIIQANVEKLIPNLSDGYFSERPRGSQLGALVSPQSQVIKDRSFLENRLSQLEKEYENKEIPRPENWGGFIAKPYEIEFWQGRPNRLHDRINYTLQEDFSWKTERLAP